MFERKLIAVFLSFLSLAIVVSAAETYSLKQNVPEGEYEINTSSRTISTGRFDIGGDFTLQTLERQIIHVEIKDKKPDGSFTRAYRYKTYKTKKVTPKGTTMEYDSEKPEKSEEPLQKIFAVVLGATFELHFDAEKRVVSTAGYDEFRKNLDALGSFQNQYEDERLRWRDHYEHSTVDSFNSISGMYPNEPVAIGQRWDLPACTIRTSAGVLSNTGNARLKSLRQIDGKDAIAVITATIAGTQVEPHAMENERGVFTYASIAWKMTMESEFDFQMAGEIAFENTIEMESRVENKSKVDTIPDFAVDTKTTSVTRSRLTPIKTETRCAAKSQAE